MAREPTRLAARLSKVKPSITLAVTARAAELKAAGVDVVSFGAGEPDFDTPEHIKEAARAALAGPAVARYTNVVGIPELRRAIADELSAAHQVSLAPADVLVSCGAKHSLYNLFQALLDPGDEVIIPAPYWVSYPDMVLLAGGEPVIIETRAEDGFALDPARLAEAVSPRTRALVLNTPSNPTGAVIPRRRLEEIAEVALEKRLLVISDDIYRSLVYGDSEYVSIASLSAEIAAQTVLVDGVSKTYAMTGWRIGYAAGPRELISAMGVIQGQSTSNPTHLAQVAALAALTGPRDCVAEMRAAFDERRREMVRRLRAIPGVRCREPEGAFYAFPDISAYVGKRAPGGATMESDIDLSSYLVEDGRVAVVPGSGFGAPGFVRLSYACSMDDIVSGIDRMGEALARLT